MRARPKFPDPPAPDKLPPADQDEDLVGVDRPLWRVFPTTSTHATAWNTLRGWGPVAARFDPHPPPPALHTDHGVLYAGSDAVTALAEAFGTNRTVDVKTGDPWLVKFTLDVGQVQLLDLTGSWPTRAGASQEIWTSPDRQRTQRWARAIATRFDTLDGLLYGSSMRGAGFHNIALWAPAAAVIAAATVHFAEPLAHPAMAAMIQDTCIRLGYEFVN